MILLTSALFGCSAGVGADVNSPSQAGSSTNTFGIAVAPLYDENTVASLYEQTIPAVVEIETVRQIDQNISGPFQFQIPIPEQRGQGSGFFIDGEGHILTNNHVVESAKTVRVILHNGEELDAQVVGTDPQNDMALLKVNTGETGKITFLPMGNSDNVRPGQMAVAMGSPYGLEGSITVGIVSGLGRSLPSDSSRTIVDVIQTDAAINPGNSGGPLLNSKGEVIGINTAIEANASSIGFAIPINMAKLQLPALLKGGELKSPWLGIEATAVDSELASKLGLPVDSGVYIINVVKGSPAEEVGLVKSALDNQGEPTGGGDVITAVDGVPVTKVEDLLSYFNRKQPGDKVSLSIYRGYNQITVPVELGEWGVVAEP